MASSSSPMRYVYIVRCADNSLYVGETDDLALRITRHNDARGCTFTATRRPVVLVYAETHATRQGAQNRERQLKHWTRKKKEALSASAIAD
jgi:predicted GIY-YIG superfamily endonuclease